MWPFDGSEKVIITSSGEKIMIDVAKVSLVRPTTFIDGTPRAMLIIVEGVEVLVMTEDYNQLYITLFG